MVSAACLAGRQTILVCFFPKNCGFAGKEKRQMGGKLKTQLHAFWYRYIPHVPFAQYLRLQLKDVFFYVYFVAMQIL